MFKLRGNLEAVRNSKTLEECVEVGVGVQMPAFFKK